jgi:ATPase subunit of ABC transporter with duplicated ATPase domains
MKHTLGTAAKACGVGRSTILRAIKTGRISASKDDTGSYSIDPAELHRVFPPVPTEQGAHQTTERDATGNGTGETPVLMAKIEGLEALLSRERETVDDLRRRLDQSEAERRETQVKLTALLTHQREPEPKAPVVEPTRPSLLERTSRANP